jgi:transposase InsO family protein
MPARPRNPELRSARAKRDERLMPHIERVWQANLQVYGADKVWKQMNREDIVVARCTVERLMRRLGLHGVRRGKTVRTTVPDASVSCPLDRVNRQFTADRPNQLWVSDFTFGLHVCVDLAGLAVRGLRRRRVRPTHCGLAC